MDKHEVEEGTLGAHTHDHVHAGSAHRANWVHEHPHVHPNDTDKDHALNEHSHVAAHVRLPWEPQAPA